MSQKRDVSKKRWRYLVKSLKIRLFGAATLLGMMLLTSGINAGEDAREYEEIEKAEPSQSFMQRGWQYAKNNPKKAAVGLAAVTAAGLSTRRYMQNRQTDTEQLLREQLDQTLTEMKDLAFHVLNGYARDYAEWNSEWKDTNSHTHRENPYGSTEQLNNAILVTQNNLGSQTSPVFSHATIEKALSTIQQIHKKGCYRNGELNRAVGKAIAALYRISQYRNEEAKVKLRPGRDLSWRRSLRQKVNNAWQGIKSPFEGSQKTKHREGPAEI